MANPDGAASALPDSGLGDLAKLPPEVRARIWPRLLSPQGPPTGRRILLVSKRVHHEVIAEVFSNRMVNILVRQQPHSGKHAPSRFVIFDSLFFFPPPTPKFLTFDMFDDGEACWRLAHMPYGRASAIKIHVRPFDSGDPGQLVAGWNKMVFIVNYLSFVDRLPPIEIRFLGEPDDWARSQCPRRSVTSIGSDERGDLDLMLLPFRRVRRVESITIRLPEGSGTRVETLAEEIRTKAVTESAFDPCEHADDCEIISLEWAWSAWLENSLDDLPGATAKKLRWEQLRSFTPDYYYSALRRILKARKFFSLEQIYALAAALDYRRRQVTEGRIDAREPKFSDIRSIWERTNVRNLAEAAVSPQVGANRRNSSLFGYTVPAFASPKETFRETQGRLKEVPDVPRRSETNETRMLRRKSYASRRSTESDAIEADEKQRKSLGDNERSEQSMLLEEDSIPRTPILRRSA